MKEVIFFKVSFVSIFVPNSLFVSLQCIFLFLSVIFAVKRLLLYLQPIELFQYAYKHFTSRPKECPFPFLESEELCCVRKSALPCYYR